MNIFRAEGRRRLELCEETCRKAGYKPTQQRREIYREVVKSTGHPDGEAVEETLRRRVPSVSQDTVYRTLRMSTDLEVIDVLPLDTAGSRSSRHQQDHWLRARFPRESISEKTGNERNFEREQ